MNCEFSQKYSSQTHNSRPDPSIVVTVMVTPLIAVAAIYILGIISGFYCPRLLNFSFFALVTSFLIALIFFSCRAYFGSSTSSSREPTVGRVPTFGREPTFGKRNPKISKTFLFFSIFIAGFVLCHIHLYPPSPLQIKNFISPWATEITGTIVEEPQWKENRLSFLLKCEKWTPGFKDDTWSYPVKGLVRATCSIEETESLSLSYGDRVLVFGRLQEPVTLQNPILFNYKTYLRNKGIFAVFNCDRIEKVGKGSVYFLARITFLLRRFLKENIDRTISGEEAGLLKGIMLGDKKDIFPDLRNSFISTGLAHTLAVSGLHVGLVASIFYFFFRFLRLSKRASAVFNIPVVIIYCLITGANPPVVRATILSVIVLTAIIIEREPDLLNNLALAGLIILLINPLSLFDASFQLSFVATLGIIYLTPFFENWFLKFLPRWIAMLLSVSIAAQIFVAPLIAYYFNKVSIIALIANLFVVPIMGVILALGFASAVLGTFCFTLAKFAAMANFACLWYFIRAVKFFGSFPFASLNVATPSIIFIAGYYLGTFTPLLKHGRVGLDDKRIFLGLLLVVAIFIWSRILVPYSADELKIVFFDTGQGQSAFIKFPNGGTALIDGADQNGGEYVLSPFLREQGIYKIDAVFSTHSHTDHIGGLLVIAEEFKIGRIFAGILEDSSSYEALKSGDEIKIGDRIRIEVFNPSSHFLTGIDNSSLVLKLSYGKFETLFPADIYSDAQNGLVKSFSEMLDADILQVPHHGSIKALNLNFLETIKPEVVVIQPGKFNRFGFPDKKVIDVYKKFGAQVYRTDTDGAIQITTDGNTYSIKKYGGR